jgi:hypothetical protein
MEARLRLPHSLSQPRPMRRAHNEGPEEPRRERSQAKERPGPSRRETASSTGRAVERRGTVAVSRICRMGTLPSFRYEAMCASARC